MQPSSEIHEVRHCVQCEGEAHIVSPTVDSTKTVVGHFCHRSRLMAQVDSTTWNGVDVMPLVRDFIVEQVDFKALVKMRRERLTVLAKKLAYLHMQTSQAKELRLNYAVMQWHYTAELHELHKRLTVGAEGDE